MSSRTRICLIGFAGLAGCGKDTAADFLVQKRQFQRIAFADALKDIARREFGWDGKKDDRGRRLLQRLGTEVGRAYNPDLWVQKVEDVLAMWDSNNGPPRVVIPDVRFSNEVDMIHANEGRVFGISGRGGLSDSCAQHPSEAAQELDVDTWISNKDTIEKFEHNVLMNVDYLLAYKKVLR